MLIHQVWINTLDFIRVEIVQAFVKIERDYGHVIADEYSFGLLKNLFAHFHVRLLIGPNNERVFIRIFQDGSIVVVSGV
jgi:hypothetical protein